VYQEYLRDINMLRKKMKKTRGTVSSSFSGVEQLRKLSKNDAGFVFENNQLFTDAIYSNEDSGIIFLEVIKYVIAYHCLYTF
jgi:hypothetical protein